MRLRILGIALAAFTFQSCFAQTNGTAGTESVTASRRAAYAPVHEFDSKRDAGADVQAAIAEARLTGKRILLYIGGNWCAYCGQMGELLHNNPDLFQLRETSFITVYVYYGPENYNKAALSNYGKVLGVPHLFVLDSDGTLLHSQHLLDLRANGGYSPAKMKEFFKQWAQRTEAAQMIAGRAKEATP